MEAKQPKSNAATEGSHDVCPREMFVPNEVVQNGNLDGARCDKAIVGRLHSFRKKSVKS